METNTRNLIEKAESALRTKQPNLAMLYMKNAREHNAIDRIQNRSGKSVEQVWESVANSLKPLADTIRQIGEELMKAGRDFFEAYKKAVAEQAKKEVEGK